MIIAQAALLKIESECEIAQISIPNEFEMACKKLLKTSRECL
jgi:hypothetical protein